MFDKIDHWAKKATPITVMMEVIKTTNPRSSMFQIPAKTIPTKIHKNRLMMRIVMRFRLMSKSNLDKNRFTDLLATNLIMMDKTNKIIVSKILILEYSWCF
jgi:malate/lactate dehydrogenase